jgi:hypothetical protein
VSDFLQSVFLPHLHEKNAAMYINPFMGNKTKCKLEIQLVLFFQIWKEDYLGRPLTHFTPMLSLLLTPPFSTQILPECPDCWASTFYFKEPIAITPN